MNRGISPKEFQETVDPDPQVVSLKGQLQEALVENKRLTRELGSDLALFDALKSGIYTMPPYRMIQPTKPKLGAAHLEAVFIGTDQHAEESVVSEEMEGTNKYDWATFENRMQKCTEKVQELTEIMRQAAHIPVLNLWYLGDWFLGQIHPDELCGASMPLPIALPMAARVCADQVLKLAATFEKVKIVGMVGNHGRTCRKPVNKMTADRNWDMTLYLIAREFTRAAKNVEWVLPKSMMYVVDVLGWKNLVTHGDCVKSSHRTPYFAIEDSFLKQHQTRRKSEVDFDFAWMGHWHHFGLLREEIMVCPSLIGSDQYSQYRLHVKSSPSQLLSFFSEKHGRTAYWPITL